VAGGSGLEDDLVSRRAAELELQKRKAQEEKIYYDAETGEEPHHNDEVEAPSMSATSYPGMEWWDPLHSIIYNAIRWQCTIGIHILPDMKNMTEWIFRDWGCRGRQYREEAFVADGEEGYQK